MPYLIDGHNLIGHLPDLSLSDPHDEAKLVGRLKRAMMHKHKRCVVVFDAGLPGGVSREFSTAAVQVIFARGGTTADAIILERIRNTRDPGSLIVVSADQDIVQAATRRHIRVITPQAFAAELDTLAVTDKSDPHLTPDELDAWLDLFGGEPDHQNPST
jgi:predicted RNA-binding protein with PIN domain